MDRRRDPDRRFCHTPDDSMSRSVCSSCGKSPVWSDSESEGSSYPDGQSDDEPEEEGALHRNRPVQSNVNLKLFISVPRLPFEVSHLV